MKKYLALILGVLFVLGFAASAFAIHAEIPSETQSVVAKGSTQITIGGEIRFRGETRQNTADFNSDVVTGTSAGRTQEGTFYDARVRLSVDAQVTPNTEGFVQIEAGAGDTSDNWTWGPSTSGAKGIYRVGNVKQGQFNLLQAWIQTKGSGLVGFPLGVKVGHMPLALGNGLFFDHTKFGDDAILVFSNPIKELEVDVLTAKFREGNISFSDDANAYVFLFAYNTKEFGLSGDVTYVDDQGTIPTVGPKGPATHLWNFGLRGNTNIAGFGLKLDGELQTGSVDTQPDQLDFSGWALLLNASYKLDPVKLALEFAYGSGGNGDNAGNIKSFVTSLGTDKHYTYVYEYSTVNACGQASGGLCNTFYIKLGSEFDITKELSGAIDLYWLQASKTAWDANGDGTFGPYSFKWKPQSKNIGTEFDWKLNYKLDKNLNYWIEGGYLIAGKFWDQQPGKDASDPWALRNGIQLTF